jgi:transcription elongation GreA/GreB family factor
MSKAFTREDVDPPQRSGRMRSASGLPPGAVNYITASGAQRLQAEVAALRNVGESVERIAELEAILASTTVVDPPSTASNSIAFGATVTLQYTDGKTERYIVVGVDEVGFEPGAVSWISPTGKTLLAANLGDRVKLEDGRSAKIVKVEYRAD